MNLMIALFPEKDDFQTIVALRLVISTALIPYGASGTSVKRMNRKIQNKLSHKLSFVALNFNLI